MTKKKAKKKEKVAVVLLNLGGPDSKNAIKPFLMNFFMDKNILPLPIPFRCILAAMIANRRSKREAGESYGELGDKSPLLENSEKQAKALEKALKSSNKNATFKTFICMRYWHPMSPQVVREVRDWGADRIVLLPLYPQFSTTTTWSSLGVWDKAMFEAGYSKPTSTICCYPFNEGFITASAENIKAQYDQALKDGYENPRILFSAHGLPESVIKGGDPYQWQCEQTAQAIVQKFASMIKKEAPLHFSKGNGERVQARPAESSAKNSEKSERNNQIDWAICYQSRVGPKKWIGPSTEEEIERAAHDGKAIIIYPHAFTQEHVETLVELDIEYREEAEKMGQHGYYRAETVGTHPKFIDDLAKLVEKHLKKEGAHAEGMKALCPGNHERCCMRSYEPLDLKEKAA